MGLPSNPPKLSREEEHRLFTAYYAGDEAAGEELLLAFLPLAFVIANRTSNGRLCEDDCNSIAALTTWRVLSSKKVDLEHASGAGFGALLDPWIRFAVIRELMRVTRRAESAQEYIHLCGDADDGVYNVKVETEADALIAECKELLPLLPARQATIIRLCGFEGLTLKEAAGQLGLGYEGARQLWCRAGDSLRQMLKVVPVEAEAA